MHCVSHHNKLNLQQILPNIQQQTILYQYWFTCYNTQPTRKIVWYGEKDFPFTVFLFVGVCLLQLIGNPRSENKPYSRNIKCTDILYLCVCVYIHNHFPNYFIPINNNVNKVGRKTHPKGFWFRAFCWPFAKASWW